MAFPVGPEEFKALIIEPDDTLRNAFIKLIRLKIAWYKNYRYMFRSSGELTEAFKNDICNLGCGGPQ